jgi:hypothetical protein
LYIEIWLLEMFSVRLKAIYISDEVTNVTFGTLLHYSLCIFLTVQKPHHVRITDFGLAKLLDSKHSEFKSQGGRVSDLCDIVICLLSDLDLIFERNIIIDECCRCPSSGWPWSVYGTELLHTRVTCGVTVGDIYLLFV